MKIYLIIMGMLLFPLSLSCTPVLPEAERELPHVKAEERKKLVSATYRESVKINGELYAVPMQWVGRRIDAPPLAVPELSPIPRSLAHRGGELYLYDPANRALQVMASAAAEDGVFLTVHSAYRSIWYQRKIFKRMLGEGRSFDDIIQYVAPPGYSEHALGTVVDFFPSNWQFAETEQYHWLREHADQFHFRESYPEDAPDGLPWEAWHWRWIKPEER